MYRTTGAFVTPGDCFGEARSMRIGYAGNREILIRGLQAVSDFSRMTY